MKKKKAQIWSEDEKGLTKQRYVVARKNSISFEEARRFNVLDVKNKPMLPEEWVIIRT